MGNVFKSVTIQGSSEEKDDKMNTIEKSYKAVFSKEASWIFSDPNFQKPSLKSEKFENEKKQKNEELFLIPYDNFHQIMMFLGIEEILNLKILCKAFYRIFFTNENECGNMLWYLLVQRDFVKKFNIGNCSGYKKKLSWMNEYKDLKEYRVFNSKSFAFSSQKCIYLGSCKIVKCMTNDKIVVVLFKRSLIVFDDQGRYLMQKNLLHKKSSFCFCTGGKLYKNILYVTYGEGVEILNVQTDKKCVESLKYFKIEEIFKKKEFDIFLDVSEKYIIFYRKEEEEEVKVWDRIKLRKVSNFKCSNIIDTKMKENILIVLKGRETIKLLIIDLNTQLVMCIHSFGHVYIKKFEVFWERNILYFFNSQRFGISEIRKRRNSKENILMKINDIESSKGNTNFPYVLVSAIEKVDGGCSFFVQNSNPYEHNKVVHSKKNLIFTTKMVDRENYEIRVNKIEMENEDFSFCDDFQEIKLKYEQVGKFLCLCGWKLFVCLKKGNIIVIKIIQKKKIL